MKAAVYYSNRDIRIVEMTDPAPGPGEVLVRIYSSGICGSDVLEWYRIKTAPRVLGHEVAGVVERVGPGVEKFAPGDRVFVTHHVPCNTCPRCTADHHTDCDTLHRTNFDPGGFAQLVKVPALQVERGMLHLPPGMSFDAASFTEPLACVVRGQRVAGLRPGMSLAVIGAGISGMLHIALARARGAYPIVAIDTSEPRRRMALRFGAQCALSPHEDAGAELRRLAGRMAEVVIVCAGVLPAFRQALEIFEPGGTILAFAVPPPGEEMPFVLFDFWKKGGRLVSTYAGALADCREALGLIAAGAVPVEEMITHRLPLEEIQRGFDLVLKGGEALKVIIRPNGPPPDKGG
jgi:L-iditol 2-dehydrogenase